MTRDQQRLLDALLDSLDRLYDRECGVVDVQALTAATAAALVDLPHWSHRLAEVAASLLTLMRSGRDREEQYRQSLIVTDELRLHLADLPQGRSP
jgi:hypothetical protein